MFYLFGPPQVGRCHRAYIPFGMLRAVLELEVPKAAPNACPRRELLFSIKLKEGAVMKKLPSSCVESPRERALAGDPVMASTSHFVTNSYNQSSTCQRVASDT